MVIQRSSFGSAKHYLDGHSMTLKRYLQTFYPPYDWNIIKSFFIDNPIQAKHILNDFSKTNDTKLIEVSNIFINGKSKIVFIIGARGSGKTATAFMLGETVHKEIGRAIFYVSRDVDEKYLPKWIKKCNTIQDVPKGSFAIIDESAIQFNARRSMEKDNKQLGEELAIARHRDLFLIFITQHAAMTDANVDRLKDLVIWKRSNDYTFGVRGTRTREGKFWSKVRNMMSPRDADECLFEYPAMRRFIHFKHELPECWTDELSKTWKDAQLTKKKEEEIVKPKPKRKVLQL